MSGAAHTPGPWTAGSDNWVVTADDGFVAQCFDGTRSHADDEAIGAANARLIAAAPDLLAFAETVSRFTEYDCADMDGSEMEDALQTVNGLIRQARAAIAKATGAPSPAPSDLELAGAGVLK